MPWDIWALQGNHGQWWEESGPTEHSHLALDWLNTMGTKAQTPRSSIAQLFRRKTLASWIFSLSSGGNALWEIDVDMWRLLAMTSVKPRLRTFWSTSLPLTPVQDRGRHLTDTSNQLHTPSSLAVLAAGREGELQAGWTWNSAVAPPEFQVPQGVLSTTWNGGCFRVQMQYVFVLLLFAPECKYQVEARRCGALQTILTVNKENLSV